MSAIKILRAYISRRLSRQFSLWFFLVLCIPLGLLVYFSVNTIQDRRRLLAMLVSENQNSQALELEEFYRTQFLKTYHSVILEVFTESIQGGSLNINPSLDFKNVMAVQSVVDAVTEHGYTVLLPTLGIRIDPGDPGRKEREAHSFIHFEVLKFNLKDRGIYDIFDAMAESQIYGLKLPQKRGKDYQDGSQFNEDWKLLVQLRGFRSEIFSSLQTASIALNPGNALKVFRPLTKLFPFEKIKNWDKNKRQKLQTALKRILSSHAKNLETFQEARTLYIELRKFVETNPDRMARLIRPKMEGWELDLRSLKGLEEFLKQGLASPRAAPIWSKMMVSRTRLIRIKKLLSVLEEQVSGAFPTSLSPDPRVYFRKIHEKGLSRKDWFDFFRSFDIYAFPLASLIAYLVREPRVSMKLHANKLPAFFLMDEAENLEEDPTGDWKALRTIISYICRYLFLGSLLMDEDEKTRALAITGFRDVGKTYRKFFTMEAGEGSIQLVWDVFPKEYDTDGFVMGAGPRPEGLMFGLLRLDDFALHFGRLLDLAGDSLRSGARFRDSYQMTLPLPLRQNFPSMDITQAHSKLQKLWEAMVSLRVQSFSPTMGGPGFFEFFLSFLGFDESYRISRDQWWKRSTSLKAVYPAKSWAASQVRSAAIFENVILPLASSAQIREELNDWLAGDASTYAFNYSDKEGRYRIATLVRPRGLRHGIFFLSLDSQIAFQENQYLYFLVFGFCLLAMVISGVLGRFLAWSIVEPVRELTERVQDYSQGKAVGRLNIGRGDEIGRMAHLFNQMVASVNDRLQEMGAVNRLNEHLLEGESLSVILSYAVTRFVGLSSARFGFIGFFESGSREHLSISESHLDATRILDNPEALQNSFVELVLPYLDQSEQLHEISSDQSLKLGFKNMFIQIIRPAVQGLDEVGEVLEEFSSEGRSLLDKEAQILGFLVLADCESGEISQETRGFIDSFGNQTGLVLLKAWLDQIRKDNEEGRDIQEQLMPPKTPDTGGCCDLSYCFKPARYLGGDFVDFLSFSDSGTFGVIIADVSGKGVGPALFGATAKAFFQGLAEEPHGTGTTLKNLNNRLCEENPGTLFSTAFYFTLDTRSLKMTYSCAGHNKMLRFSSKTGSLEYLSASGLVLGMFEDGDYEVLNLGLDLGDWVILYTDGVTELENMRLELYGLERLEDFILQRVDGSAREMKLELLEELDRFRQDRPYSDDLSFVMMKIIARG
jgi:serine phosphatase RsbU (regulator of sigma subunit)/HAMP domain-containing protein